MCYTLQGHVVLTALSLVCIVFLSGNMKKKIQFQLENYWKVMQRYAVDTPVKLFPGVQVKFLVISFQFSLQTHSYCQTNKLH